MIFSFYIEYLPSAVIDNMVAGRGSLLVIVHNGWIVSVAVPKRFMETSPVKPFESGACTLFGNGARNIRPSIRKNNDFVSINRADILVNRSFFGLCPDANIGIPDAVNENPYPPESFGTLSENFSTNVPISRFTATNTSPFITATDLKSPIVRYTAHADTDVAAIRVKTAIDPSAITTNNRHERS